jgi:membrane protein YqaA with SNARE-associated domain
MITMSWWYLWFALGVTAFAASFASYWIGRDAGEKSQLMKRWDDQTERMERTQRLMAENHRLRKQVEALEGVWFPESTWNNVRSVPGQSVQ